MTDLKIKGQSIANPTARRALEKLRDGGLEPEVFVDGDIGSDTEANKLLNRIQDKIVDQDDYEVINESLKKRKKEELTPEEFIALGKEFEKSFSRNKSQPGFVGLSTLFGISKISKIPPQQLTKSEASAISSIDLTKEDTWTLLLVARKKIPDPSELKSLFKNDLPELRKKYENPTWADKVDVESLREALEARIPKMSRDQLGFLEVHIGFPSKWSSEIARRVTVLDQTDQSILLPKWKKPIITRRDEHLNVLLARMKPGLSVEWYDPGYPDYPELRVYRIFKQNSETTVRFATPAEAIILMGWEVKKNTPTYKI